MIARHSLIALSAFAITLCVCRVAHANSLSPYVYFWPGIVSITLVYAFPASLLAAFLERPFLTAAGIKRRPLVLSLRANFLSTIAGILLIPIGDPALYTIGPLWCIVAFGVSCAVEIFYLRRFSHQSFTWGRVAGGNAVSSAVLMILPPIAIAIRQSNYRLAWSLEPHQAWLAWSSLAVSVALFLASFAWPSVAKSETAPIDSDIPGSTATELEADSVPSEMETETTV
ncbi:MAG: hypothetical protein KY476_07425 [Planctomycetes bacterium]|nr:hypothetical protein [Planctomycetota bacterium]